MLFKENQKSAEDFWLEYEGQIGEKVLARGLGRYVSGWEEFDSKGWTSIWGLIIATSGGFRFHHFPQTSWLQALTNFGNNENQKGKTFFIPKENIISSKLIEETKWWKKIFISAPPQLLIDYKDGTENTKQVLLEAEFKHGNLAQALNSFQKPPHHELS
jgi:hypothetical protein